MKTVFVCFVFFVVKTISFVHFISIKDFMNDNSRISNGLRYMSSLRVFGS